MGKNIMRILSDAKLEKLTTPRLMAYRKRLLKANELDYWDETCLSFKPLSKASETWQKHYAKVKSTLDQREHIS